MYESLLISAGHGIFVLKITTKLTVCLRLSFLANLVTREQQNVIAGAFMNKKEWMVAKMSFTS